MSRASNHRGGYIEAFGFEIANSSFRLCCNRWRIVLAVIDHHEGTTLFGDGEPVIDVTLAEVAIACCDHGKDIRMVQSNPVGREAAPR